MSFSSCKVKWRLIDLRVQVLPLHAQIGVDDVQADEQPGDDGALLLHHQGVWLVKLTARHKQKAILEKDISHANIVRNSTE